MRNLLDFDTLTEALTNDMPNQQPIESNAPAEIEFINLTPHTINVLDLNGKEHAIPASGQQARIAMSTADAGTINNFKLTKQVTGEVTGLPPVTPGKAYIVSAMIAQAAKRPDVVSPDTGPSAIREGGLIKAVKGFVTY